MSIELPIVLFLAYVMPGHQPDIQYKLPESSIEECWEDAREFVKRGVPKIAANKGAIAVLAGCRAVPPEEQEGSNR